MNNVHQFLPVLARYDAIGETVLQIQNTLKNLGYNSKIFVETQIDQTKNITKKHTEYIQNDSDVIIYHHSIGSILADFTSKLNVKKILFYHNVTPPEFFENYNKEITAKLYTGRNQTKTLAKHFEFAMAASNYNRSELYLSGFKKILPSKYLINFERFDTVKSKEEIIEKYEKTTNIIFVGRRSPNKKIEDLFKIFAFLKIFRPNSKLFILGGSWVDETYQKSLEYYLDLLQIKNDVVMVNTMTDEELASYYKLADIFLCMSEHEGFCIPLVEAMYFQVPIIAYNSSAIPNTLNGSGILINHKKYHEIALLIDIFLKNTELRKQIIDEQTKNLQLYSIENAMQVLKDNLILIINSLNKT